MQTLNVSLSITIPNDLVLVSKVELEELKTTSLSGVYWSMKDLEERTGRKVEWLKTNLLYIPRFKKILDVNQGGFVYYPERRGQAWSFQAQRMASFLDNNFGEIFSETP